MSSGYTGALRLSDHVPSLAMLCARADDGNEFYVDPKTKQRTTQRPEAEAWISLYDDDRERNYYFNEVSNVRIS